MTNHLVGTADSFLPGKKKKVFIYVLICGTGWVF